MANFDWSLILPVVTVAAYGLLTLLLVPFHRDNTRILGFVTLIGLLMGGFTLYRLWGQMAGGPLETGGMIRIDAFGLYFSFLVVAVGLLSTLVSMTFLERESADFGEFYPLMLFCIAGMLVMLHTTHLILILIGLEIFSLALYVLTGLTRARLRSVEAALKYFLLGAFSSGFIAYGMALLYGSTGSLDLGAIYAAAASDPMPLLWIGMGFVVVGLAFKIAAVPFHTWVPDVYQGAPTNVTGFMAAATKTVAFAVLLRFLVGTFSGHEEVWAPIVTWMAILTMTVGNLIALAQTNLKRMLAFSSIAHAGYLLIAVVCQRDAGVGAIVFYLTVYIFMTVGAFTVLAAGGRGDADGESGYTLADWSGLGWRRPALGVAMMFFLLSLAGIPPTGGFIGKYVIFQAAIQSQEYLLAIVGGLNAAIAAYYYLRVIVCMYMREGDRDDQPLPVSPAMATVLIVSVVGVIYLGIAPGRVLQIVQGLATSLI